MNGIGQVDAKILWRHAHEVGGRFSQPIRLEYCSWVREPLEAVKEKAGAVPDEELFERLAKRADRRAAEL